MLVVEFAGMQRKKVSHVAKTAGAVADANATSEPDPRQIVLSMLESLVDALDSKAEEVEGSGDSDDDDIRAQTMRDVAEAIRDRFAL